MNFPDKCFFANNCRKGRNFNATRRKHVSLCCGKGSCKEFRSATNVSSFWYLENFFQITLLIRNDNPPLNWETRQYSSNSRTQVTLKIMPYKKAQYYACFRLQDHSNYHRKYLQINQIWRCAHRYTNLKLLFYTPKKKNQMVALWRVKWQKLARQMLLKIIQRQGKRTPSTKLIIQIPKAQLLPQSSRILKRRWRRNLQHKKRVRPKKSIFNLSTLNE